MRLLERDYVFEFAGMPQSGKTAVREIIAHYLKRMEYPLVEFNGGSRSSRHPVNHIPIGKLNELLAEDILQFFHSTMKHQYADHNIYLLDRGLIDRCIFTDSLVQDKKVSPEQASLLYASLTDPRLLKRLNDVFIFTVSPEIALQREYKDKLVKPENVRSQGEVMNERFLSKMFDAGSRWYYKIHSDIKHIEIVDTTETTKMQDVARTIFNGIRERYPELELELETI
jgi:hypothetical protein